MYVYARACVCSACDSIDVWGGRNCPAVITVGDLKYMMGFVGDPRLVAMDEATNNSVPFGQSGGRYNWILFAC